MAAGGGGEVRRAAVEEEILEEKNCKHPVSLSLPPTLLFSLTFFLSVAEHKTSSSAIRATWPLGPRAAITLIITMRFH